MVQRHPKRSDQEWMELIQECGFPLCQMPRKQRQSFHSLSATGVVVKLFCNTCG